MKLVRLTTQSNTAQFDTYFNEDIQLNEKSQVCLHSVSLESQTNAIRINGTNDNITYNLRGASAGSVDKKIVLEHIKYDTNNFNLLLTDIETKCNKELEQVGKHIGIQFEVKEGTKKHIEIKTTQADFLEFKTEFMANQSKHVTTGADTIASTAGGLNNNSIFNAIVGHHPSNHLDTYSYLEFPISRGCGVFRHRVSRLGNSSADATECGYIVGLSSSTTLASKVANNEALNLSDINYGIDLGRTDTEYHKIVSGTKTASGTTPNIVGAGSASNDLIDIVVELGRVKVKVWVNNTALPIVILDEPYDNKTELFPVMIFRGDETDRAKSFRFSPDPYLKPPLNIQHIDELGTTSQPQQTQLPSSQFISFESQSLSKYLGFENTRQPVSGFSVVKDGFFEADNQFSQIDSNDNFLVLLDNIQLDSYDSYDDQGNRKGGRQSILAVIPQSDSNKSLLFEPQHQVFIDINNVNKINIRNIKARIVKTDYSEVNTLGLSALTILFK